MEKNMPQKKTAAKKKTIAKKKAPAKKAPAAKKKTVVKKKAVSKKAPAVKKKVITKKQPAAMPNIMTPNKPVTFTEKCNGCNTCVETCQVDVFIPNPEKGKSPIILYPEECWYCGCCANDCPRHAIEFHWALQHRGYWKNKTTGKVGQI
jgi:NAD-dependent dihydropyrimidine dehydrogenase PreA subunit